MTAAVSAVVHAGERKDFAVPAGPLRVAVVALGNQADVTIGLTDASLDAVRVRGVRGRLSVAAALDRLLAGTPARVERIDAVTYRIVRRAVPPRRRPAAPPAPPSSPSSPSIPPVADIVVTGSKRATRLADYSGSVVIIDASTLRPASMGRGSRALVEQQPILSSTHLGPGRDKLFIRGAADSSFSGPTQATVGEYLGDVRLNYNAPDPDLALYDIASVEVLEGPQGTLYGAGSLGGILRLVPVEPDLAHWSATLDAGVPATAHGHPGTDGALVANVPIVEDRLALRVVGYSSVEGGYIDDVGRGLTDINRTRTHGARVSLRYQPSATWTIDLGGVRQDIASRDGQYADRDLPPLQRTSAIAQPFDNDYSLGGVAIRHRMGSVMLSSSTSVIGHELTTTFDATGTAASPIAYRQDERITLLSNETRLSRPASGEGMAWVAGFELLHSNDSFTRA